MKRKNNYGKARRPYALNQKGGAIKSGKDKLLERRRSDTRILIRRGWFD